MGAQLRVYRRRIKSVQATKKITKAMELIASSRIVKAQQRLEASLPYLTHLYAAINAAATDATDVSKHPLMANTENRTKAAVLVVTADRGLAGAYSSNAIKEAEALTTNLREKGISVVPYVVGRKGVSYYRFRERDMGGEYTGFTDQPTYADAKAHRRGPAGRLHDPDGGGRRRRDPHRLHALPLDGLAGGADPPDPAARGRRRGRS